MSNQELGDLVNRAEESPAWDPHCHKCFRDECSPCPVCGCCYNPAEYTVKCVECYKIIPKHHCICDHDRSKDCLLHGKSNNNKCYDSCEHCKKAFCHEPCHEMSPKKMVECRDGNDIRYFCIDCCNKSLLCIEGHYYPLGKILNIQDYYREIISLKDLRNGELEKQVQELQNIIDYMPDGKGFNEAKDHFLKMASLHVQDHQ